MNSAMSPNAGSTFFSVEVDALSRCQMNPFGLLASVVGKKKDGVVWATPSAKNEEVNYSTPFQAPKLAPDSIHFLIRA